MQWRCLSAGASLGYIGTRSALLLVIGLVLIGRERTAAPARFQRNSLQSARVVAADPSTPTLWHSQRPAELRNPGGGRFKLAVVVVKSVQQPPLPDPVVYIDGGPGAPLTIYADQQARMPYAPRRDLTHGAPIAPRPSGFSRNSRRIAIKRTRWMKL